MELKKKTRRQSGADLWEIDNGFSVQYLQLTNAETVELYKLLGEALKLTP